MLGQIRQALIASTGRLGMNGLVRDSEWRSQRLLILCYHGIALRDEHLWHPDLYIQRTQFEERMAHLRRTQCQVLPLSEGLERLRQGTLPKRSVCVTFDDGMHDFYEQALPILRRLEIPATVYLSTYYVFFNRPVFDVMLAYLLWKAAGRKFHLESIIPRQVTLDKAVAAQTFDAIMKHTKARQLSGQAKDALLGTIAEKLAIDYDELLRQRILHLMSPEEVRRAVAAGVDIQLHTHRHRLSYNGQLFLRDLDDNRDKIASLTEASPMHFCYPGGNYLSQYDELLSDWGALSAASCESGLCSPRSNFYRLPRVLDSSRMTAVEFEAWVSGLAAFVPRHYPPATGQFLED